MIEQSQLKSVIQHKKTEKLELFSANHAGVKVSFFSLNTVNVCIDVHDRSAERN